MAASTKIKHWREWRRRCAIAKCRVETAEALRSYARHRFTYFLMKLADHVAFDVNVPEAAVCWSLLETHLCVARPRSGRRYKEWLFARLARTTDDPVDVIQGGATLILRTVVRDWFAGLQPSQIASGYTHPAPAGPSVVELLPAPSPTGHGDWEIHEAAQAAALYVARGLDHKTRLVLLARAWGFPLFHPLVLRDIGVGHTKASETPRRVMEALVARIRKTWEREPVSWQKSVALSAYRELVAILSAREEGVRAHAHLSRVIRPLRIRNGERQTP